MPADYKAETAILGAIKTNVKIIDDIMLAPQVFLKAKNRAMYVEMMAMYSNNIEINEITFYERIKNRTDLSASDFVSVEPWATANVQYYVDIVKKNYAIEKIRLLNLEIQDRIKSGDPGAILEFIDKYITDLQFDGGRKTVTNQEMLLDASKTLEDRYLNNRSKMIKTGIFSIDSKVGGWGYGTFNVIASRPSIGKTALALFCAYEIARTEKVGYFSLEMVLEQLHDRVCAMSSGVNIHAIRSGFLNKKDFDLCMGGLGSFFERSIFFDDTPYLRLRELKSKIRKMVRQGAKVIFVDYLTLVKINIKGMPRHEKVGVLCKELKKLAAENRIALVALSQLGRASEAAKPTLSDLRQCVHGDTIIQDQFGFNKTIREMYEENEKYKIRTIDHEGVFRYRQPAEIIHSGEKVCLKIKTKSGKEIIVSDKSLLYSNGEWVKANELKIGNKVLVIKESIIKKGNKTNTGKTHFQKGIMPWNKGLSKETDIRIKNKVGFRKNVSIPKPDNFSEIMKSVKPHYDKKIDKRGYVRIYKKGSDKNKNDRDFIYEHQDVIEKSIGRELRKEERVHHFDGDKGNNILSNLRLCKNASEHIYIHIKEQRFVENLIKEGVVIFNEETQDFEFKNKNL